MAAELANSAIAESLSSFMSGPVPPLDVPSCSLGAIFWRARGSRNASLTSPSTKRTVFWTTVSILLLARNSREHPPRTLQSRAAARPIRRAHQRQFMALRSARDDSRAHICGHSTFLRFAGHLT